MMIFQKQSRENSPLTCVFVGQFVIFFSHCIQFGKIHLAGHIFSANSRTLYSSFSPVSNPFLNSPDTFPHRTCFVEVIGFCLLLWMSLTQACSHRGFWSGPGPAEITGLGLILQRWLVWICSGGDCWLGPSSVGVPIFSLPQEALCRH